MSVCISDVVGLIIWTGQYLSAFGNADKERNELHGVVSRLQGILENIENCTGDGDTDILGKIQGPLEKIKILLKALQEDATKANSRRSDTHHKLKWFFKADRINETLTALEREKTNIIGLLQTVGLSRLASVESGLVEVGSKAESTKAMIRTFTKAEGERKDSKRIKKKIKFIAGPNYDTSIKHKSACRSRTRETGLWLTEQSEDFRKWMLGDTGTFFWLHGIAGCGKTVLCSAALERVDEHCRADHARRASASYYIDYQYDIDSLDILCSIIAQLSFKLYKSGSALPVAVQDLETRNDPDCLILALKSLVQRLEHTYVVIDALDEYPDRSKILSLMEDICHLGETQRVHVLITSRNEQEISAVLTSISARFGEERATVLPVDPNFINKDIELHTKEALEKDRELSCYPEDLKELVFVSLMRTAEGMFRLVACQIDLLRGCESQFEVEETLKTIPKTLDEVYDRIIARIPKNLRKQAYAALQWVLCAKHPLSLDALAEAAILEPDNEPILNVKKRLHTPEHIWKACSSLIKISEIIEIDEQSLLYSLFRNPDHQEIRFAHDTVRTYLLRRICTGPAYDFALSEKEAHKVVAKSCLSYLLLFKQHESMPNLDDKYPLLEYAARFWLWHLRKAEYLETSLETSLVHPFVAWIQAGIWGLALLLAALMGYPLQQHPGTGEGENLCRAKPITELIIELLDPSRHKSYIYWMATNLYGTTASPLYMALLIELPDVFKLLLRRGADVNQTGGDHHTALQLAAFQGNEEAVRLLLRAGADINARGGYYVTALAAAVAQGHDSIFRLLLESGADIHIHGDWPTGYKSPLIFAACHGQENSVSILLKKGADMNHPMGRYAGALCEAARCGNERIVKMLLESGARETPALYYAVDHERYDIARLLVENGADVNARGGEDSAPLLAAARQDSRLKLMELLLRSGADPNLQVPGFYGCALHCASFFSAVENVRLLLEAGAKIDLLGEFGTALQIAATRGSETVVKLLLEKGADVNAQGGKYGTALQAAAEKRNGVIAKILLEAGADANISGGKYGSALRAAREEQGFYVEGSWTKQAMVDLLIEHGATDSKAKRRRQRRVDGPSDSATPATEWVPR
ncbi:hypothetical protein GP486_004272 [Trichoglossum hirsutum]|uniref:Nephrocystin 3-like N-terminal domain-containing protein n=1 Tax=Trichoglossum hirsutum TaxID=265104 RepID=A0A9P8RPZ6_9PEZI|nr:hypothetical protein GP486_004272 [Trichoglossum hirsutum]